jgi:hypothetical protein
MPENVEHKQPADFEVVCRDLAEALMEAEDWAAEMAGETERASEKNWQEGRTRPSILQPTGRAAEIDGRCGRRP